MIEHADQSLNFRAVLGHFATGVLVVTANTDGAPRGMTVQSFCSLSLDPPLILICPALASTSWPSIASAKGLCINLLAEESEYVARQFAKSGGDKFAGIDWQPSPVTRSPILSGALAWLDCELAHTHPGGDHLVAVCRVLALESRADLMPLIFFRAGFTRILAHD